jgi:serine protease DegQ
MEMGGPPRPRVSRETRLLFITVLVAIVALWVLARLRFPDQPDMPNPVPQLLTQLTNRTGFEDLAVEVAGLESRLASSLVALEFAQDVAPALRIHDDVVVALLPPAGGPAGTLSPAGLTVLARDPASGLAVIRVPPARAVALPLWSPQRLEYPRYLLVSDVSPLGTSLRPVFVGALYPDASPVWSEPIWAAPAQTDLATGAFVFTNDGALAGLAIEHEGRPGILPAEAVIRLAERLVREGIPVGGWLGVEVQELTAPIAAAVGARAGVVVTWIDPRGAAADALAVMDVIETIGVEVVASVEDWEARVARLGAGDSLVLHLRRRGEPVEIELTAADGPPAPVETDLLGLTMRIAPSVGLEIVRVEPGSAAARAGVEVGDIVTLIDEVERPTPAEVTQAFQAVPDDRPILMSVTRGDRHIVLALGR